MSVEDVRFYLNCSVVLFGFSKLNPKLIKSQEAEQPIQEQVQALCILINSVSRAEGKEFHLRLLRLLKMRVCS